jgi:hypothetical protein
MLGNIMADNVLEAQVYPVNELGEIVMQTGVGTTNVVGYISSNFVPSDAVTKKMVVVGAVAITAVATVVTATSTLLASTLGQIVPVNSASNVTLTLPSSAAAFAANPFGLIVISQLGVGVPTFAPGGSDFLRATSGVPACVQYGMIAAQVISSTEWALA